MKVVIFGAGPCGLTAAWELAKKGVDVTVLEKEKSVGGLCKTVRKNGHQFDLGGHRFISSDTELVEETCTLMKGELLTRERKSVIRFDGREFDYPVNIQNLMKTFSPLENMKFAAGYIASVTGVVKSSAPIGSFENWIDQKFGRALNDFFFKPYTEKLWGIPASTLSSDWAAQRIPLLNMKEILLKALGLKKSVPRTFTTRYLYPRGGIGAIFETMAEEIKRLGGKVLTGREPLGFESENGRIRSVMTGSDGRKKKRIEADLYLSTIPLDTLANILGVGGTPLFYRSLRFLNIFLNRENLSPNTWMYVPDPGLIMTRIQEPKRRSPFSAPDGKTSVMLEIPCEKGDALWKMPDSDLLDRALGDLRSLGFDLSRDVTGCFSTYAEHAYPRYDIGYLGRVNSLRHTVDTYGNLTTLGRQGLFRYIFMDTAMIMGRKWARGIVGDAEEERADETGNEQVLLEIQSVVG